jgi:hypothetical protein
MSELKYLGLQSIHTHQKVGDEITTSLEKDVQLSCNDKLTARAPPQPTGKPRKKRCMKNRRDDRIEETTNHTSRRSSSDVAPSLRAARSRVVLADLKYSS